MNLIDVIIKMLPGILVTLELFFVTLVFSIPLGFLITLLGSSSNQIVNKIVSLYVLIMRGTPLILQMFFFYYGVPFIPVIGKYLVFGTFTTASVAFVLNYAAYFSEIFRGGFAAIPKGQHEAAKVLRMTKKQAMIKIIFPQMIRVVMPSIGNEVIILIKDTALITVIGGMDLLHITTSMVTKNANTSPFIIAGVFYLVMSFAATRLLKLIEKKIEC